MKFSLVFEHSGDTLPFVVKYNHQLMEFFIDQVNSKAQNSFTDDRVIFNKIDKKITHLHWALSKTNEIMYDLVGSSFKQNTNLEDYLDQRFLNKTHSDWVFSHYTQVDIDKLRFSSLKSQAILGNALHDSYPDEIRTPDLAPALEKLGYLYPFREINEEIHRLEDSFDFMEFKADNKWEVFPNPYLDDMVTNNDIVNFSFGYTYVGRQSYNKFRWFDTDLECPDHYNYETLEHAFQLTLQQPETIPFSTEAINWARSKNIRLVAEQIPIANLVDLETKLFDYRKVLYRNSRDNNRASIVLT